VTPSESQATTLESHPIHMIQVLSGQTLRYIGLCEVLCPPKNREDDLQITGSSGMVIPRLEKPG